MTLCKYCIDELRTRDRGHIVVVGSMEYEREDAIRQDIGCDWCEERDDLWDCLIDLPESEG